MLEKYYKDGFAAGPKESEDDFLNRIANVKKIVDNPSLISDLLIKGVTLEKLNESILFFKSNKKLPFWAAALTWKIQLENGTSIAIIQLPTKKRSFCFAKEEEIISHEKIHALRAAFNEPIFEEIIAYRTSPSRFRKYFGPLFSSNKEAAIFLTTLALSFVFSLPALIMLISIPFLFRLIRRQKKFALALKALGKRFKNPEDVITLLSDREILLAANNDLSFLSIHSIRKKQIYQMFEKLLTVDEMSTIRNL